MIEGIRAMYYSDYADNPAFEENYVELPFDPCIKAFKGIIYAGFGSVFLWGGILLLLKWLF
jgi:hypothetical protein